MNSYLSDTKIFKIFLNKECSTHKCRVEKNPHYLKSSGGQSSLFISNHESTNAKYEAIDCPNK
jgi:hypothetical protein